MKIDIQNILEKIKTVKIAVFGDLCLDAYWMMDPDGGEVSVETGLKAQAVQEQKYTLGGGANIIANLAALNPAEIKAIGAVGDDMFGYEMLRQFKDINI
ncbi:MAG: PfkB family carbohydrate kinase, partial [Candidatus Neomarinimicrobiota bacterium]|nr:PfkB family carbohydrate kinase [Candidatus Neomarinimicrobiota bacterium]